MSTIYYQIAEQYLSLTHPDSTLARRVLSKYSPFEQTDISPDAEIRLSISTDEQIGLAEGDKRIDYAEETFFVSSVYLRSDGQYYLSIHFRERCVEGLVSADWRKLRIKADWQDIRNDYLIDRLIMICYTMATLPLGYLKVHASVTELGGRALVFMGVSGTGKSTHSRLWREYVPNCTLLNDDEPIVRPMPDGSVRVYGCPWSGSTPCYRNEWAEVAAFVRLYQAKENKLARLSAREAFEELFSSCAFMGSISGNQLMVFDAVSRVLNSCAVYRLDNLPNEEAVKLSHSLI